MSDAARPARTISVGPALALFAIPALLAASTGCAKIPEGRSAVDAVEVEGNRAIGAHDIEEKIATAESPRFLGIWEGVVYDYELFDRYVFQRDLQRIERYYRARGFYDAHARAGRVVQTGDHVSVTVVVEEGPQVVIRDVEVRGLEGVPDDIAAAARRAARPKARPGIRFDEDGFKDAENAVVRALTDRGYAWAKITRNAQVDIVHHTADLVFDVQPDKKSVFGPVTIEGLGPLPEGPVRRALDIDPGEEFSTARMQRAQQAVLDLGVFSSVEIVPQTPEPPPDDHVVPLVVKVERTRLYDIVLGGGIELDALKTEGHLTAGWEARNFLGGMRHFSIRAQPGLVLYPTRLPDFQKPTDLLPELRSRAELRQPGFLEARTSGVLRAEANEYPILLATTVDPAAPVVGYRELRGTAGVDRTEWKLYAFPSYDIQVNYPFAYKGPLDPALQQITISYLELLTHLDLRDSASHPHEGAFFQVDVQYAGLGGDARDTRVQPDARAYVPITHGLTFATRASVGFLFPQNYGDTLKSPFGPPAGADRTAWARDVQLEYFRGFFSGGPSSNRGYPLRGVGPHGIVPFFSPQIATQQLVNACSPTDPNFDPVRCGIPLGGASLWEASLELRATISGPLESAFFCDASDVSPTQMQLRFDRPHLSCGAGLRYDTPVGPVRLDVGYRIPGLQTTGPVNAIEEGDPGTIFGLPIAIAFGIGEAY